MSADKSESVGLVPLGMHRSGTSLLTRVLALSGAWLGEHEDVWATGEDNPTGFWEHRCMRDINLQLLRAQGADWDLPLAFSPSEIDPRLDAELKAQAKALLREMNAHPLWAIKDPRLCLTLPWWKPMLGRTVSILIYRSPLDIARSLRVRDGFSLPFGIALWEHYTLATAAHAISTPHVVLSYDDLIDTPTAAIEDLTSGLRELGVDLHPGPMVEIEQFIRADLRHSRSTPELTRRMLSATQWEIYEALRNRNLEAITAKALSATARQAIEAEQKIRGAGLTELARRIAQIGAEVAERLDAGTAAAIGSAPVAQHGSRTSSLVKFESDVVSGLQKFSEMIEAVDRRVTEVVERAEALESEHETRLTELSEQVSKGVTLEQVQSMLDRREEIASHRVEEERRRSDIELADLRRNLLQVSQRADLTRQLQHEVDNAEDRLRDSEGRLGNLHVENLTLRKWLSDVLDWSDLTWNSARWKVGNRVIRMIEMMLLRRKPRLAADTIREVQRQFDSLGPPSGTEWAEQRASNAGTPAAPDYGLEADARSEEAARDFLVFPIIDWEFRIQRPQHLAKELAGAGHRVFYLTLQPSLGASEPGYQIISKPAQRVHVLRLAIPSLKFPNVYEDRMGESVLEELREAMFAFMAHAELKNTVSIIDLHFWRPLAMSLTGTPIIYDCMDHHGGFSTATEDSDKEEERLIRDCDLLIVTSRWLWNRFADIEPKALVPNAGEIDFFAKLPHSLIDLGRKPVAGYIGAIADWFDVDLVVKAASARPDINFVLVGSTAFCDTRPMERLPNVTLLGEVPYFEVPRYLHAFDCCIIPFQLTELIKATNPVKVYEYLAAGKPIVSTDLPELKPMAGLVHLAQDSDQFLTMIDAALIESQNQELADSRAAWARDHDWSHRRRTLLEAIDSLYAKVSVVVLCYNNLDFTRACLQSLLEFSDYPELEIIVVDNGSTDDTPAYLTEFEKRNAGVKVILNEENLGFAAGNNIGLAAATGDFLVILNNDTFVTRGWLFGLLRHFRRNPKLGLIGPVTNNIGNEARIEIHYSNMQDMASQALSYTSAHAGHLLPAVAVAFFCAAMPRAVLDEVGPMDEQFGQGFFEDDDYCRRVSKAGYEIAIAEDVFVHHHLSATFAKEDQGRRRQLFEANKKKYEAKWGKWIPHTYRTEKAS